MTDRDAVVPVAGAESVAVVGTAAPVPTAADDPESMAEGGVLVTLLLILMVLSLVVAWCVIAFIRSGRRSSRAEAERAAAERRASPPASSAWSEAGRRAVPDDDET